jgi:hypothetical protein
MNRIRGVVVRSALIAVAGASPAFAQVTSAFVPISPCRMIDTRASRNFPAPYGAPAFGTAERRVYTIDGPLSGEDRG